jgi:GGDEF domain-containing protein
LNVVLLVALALAVPLAPLAVPLAPLAAPAATEFPADGFVPGWKRSGPVETYAPTALFNVIDGGAELFLEMGFVDLRIQKYAGAGAEIVVEDYRMQNAAAALGIYLLKCGRETPLAGIVDRNSGDRFQLALLKNDHFFFINNFSGRQELLPVLAELARRLGAAIPAGEAVRELDVLPAVDRVPGSELLLRGPYSLQAVFTLGEGDVLMLAGRRFAAAAAYLDKGGAGHTLIVAPYEDAAAASLAFANLRRDLDPYLKVLEAGDDDIVFQDFQNLFGMAERRDQRITVRVKMAQRPSRQLP